MAETRCKNCNCVCHCSTEEHTDMLGMCPCQMCKCDSKGVTVDETGECETCQQIKQSVVKHTQKKKKNPENVVSWTNNKI